MNLIQRSIEEGVQRDVFSDVANQAHLRSLPLGFDRCGNSYWLFAAQEIMTLFPCDASGRSLDPADPLTTEPCILLRDPKGQWSYHCGRDINALLSSFSHDYECERVLYFRLIERYALTRSKLRVNVQSVKLLQPAWLEKKMNLERWIFEMTLYTGPNESHKCRQLEVVMARCAESRMNAYYAALCRSEEEIGRIAHIPTREALLRKQRQVKELTIEDCFDFHSIKGWSRFDVLTRVRQLAACTTATRILGDTQICATVQAALRKSPMQLSNAPPQAVEVKIDNADPNPPLSSVEININHECVPAVQVTTDNSAGANVSGCLSATGSTNNPNRKPIEQLHPITGEVLRIYPSGKDAAAFLGISHSSVSQCLNGNKADYAGFRWKFYEGPPIDCKCFVKLLQILSLLVIFNR